MTVDLEEHGRVTEPRRTEPRLDGLAPSRERARDGNGRGRQPLLSAEEELADDGHALADRLPVEGAAQRLGVGELAVAIARARLDPLTTKTDGSCSENTGVEEHHPWMLAPRFRSPHRYSSRFPDPRHGACSTHRRMRVLSRRNLLVGAGAVVAGAGAIAVEVRGMGSMDAYTARGAAIRAPLTDGVDVRELVRFATLAPSGHNTQPWRFRLSPKRIVVVPDRNRRTPAVDPDDHHLFVGLGCAVENLTLAARARGLAAVVAVDASNPIVVELESARREESPLFRAIPLRQSTRATFDGRPVPVPELRLLHDASQIAGVDVVLLTEGSALESILDLVVARNRSGHHQQRRRHHGKR